MRFPPLFLFVALLVAGSPARALDVQGVLVDQDGSPGPMGRWTLDLILDNSAGGLAVEEWTLFFPFPEVTSLAVLAAPPGWDWLVVPEDPLLADGAFVDGLALAQSLEIGAVLAGLVLAFEWTGDAPPDLLEWTVVDPVTFATLEAGTVTIIPEPSTSLLLSLGLISMARPRAPERVDGFPRGSGLGRAGGRPSC